MKSYAALHRSLFQSRLDLRLSLRFFDIADSCNIGSCCQGPRRVKKSGVKHTPMASAGARAYNGGLGAAPSGGPGAEPPVGVRGRIPLKSTSFFCFKQ